MIGWKDVVRGLFDGYGGRCHEPDAGSNIFPSTTGALRGVPAKPEDYHGRKPTARELRQIFRLETERRISNDWVLRHEGRYLQLQPAGQRRYGPTHSKALVCEWEDGAVEVYYRGQRLAYRELAEPLPRKCEVEDRTKHSIGVPLFGKPRKPSQDHPWRRDYRDMKPSWSRKVEIPPRTVTGTEASL